MLGQRRGLCTSDRLTLGTCLELAPIGSPLGDGTPPANMTNRLCLCIVLMLERPPSSSPANVGHTAGAGAVLAHRVRRWPKIVPHRLSVARLLCRTTLHSECTISSRYAYM